jgi:5'-nucleotidase/UDP-sugar diphosphatase
MRRGVRWGLTGCWGLAALGCAPAPPALAELPSQLTLLHTADLHSHVWPFRARITAFEASLGLGRAGALEELGGASRLATVLRAQRAQGPLLWLDSGDALEGSEIFERFGGRVELELLSTLGLSAMALGNHELSLDAGALGSLLQGAASFPVLAANLLPSPGSPLSRLLTGSVRLEAQGLVIGVIGVANPTSPPELAGPSNRWELSLVRDVASAVQAAIDDVSPHVHLVIVLSHLGLDADRALVRATSGIDLVLGGHQHLVTPEPEWENDCADAGARRRACSSRRVPIVHSGAYGKLVSRLELSLVSDAQSPGGLEIAALALEQLPLSARVPESPELSSYLEQFRPAPRAPLGFVPQTLRRRSALGGDSPLGDLTADAMQLASGADVALLNSSGLRADIEPGLLLASDLALAFPFAEPWLSVWLTGAQLRDGIERAARRSASQGCETALQVSGLRLQLHCAACAARQRDCVSLARLSVVGERALADDELLLVALPEYLTQRGADFAGVGEGAPQVAVTVVQAIERWLRELQPCGATRTRACVEAFQQLSEARCKEAFGALACPITGGNFAESCGDLRCVEAERDGRLQLSP